MGRTRGSAPSTERDPKTKEVVQKKGRGNTLSRGAEPQSSGPKRPARGSRGAGVFRAASGVRLMERHATCNK